MSDPQVDLISNAYSEVGEYYRNSVEVTKYTWTRFELKVSGLFVAVAYIVVKYPQYYWIASLLLVVVAFMSFGVNWQMKKNQTVIQRAMAAGALLEYRNEELGFLYRNTIPFDHRKEFNTKYSGGITQMTPNDICSLGEIPNTLGICSLLMTISLILAITIPCLIQKTSEIRTSTVHMKGDLNVHFK